MNRYLALIVGLGISAVAAYYSIVGLMTIFSGSPISVAIMGIALEIGKIVTASYLYKNWDELNRLMRCYFTTAVLVLMLITSLGIFGFLSKAHIEQTTETGNSRGQIERIDVSIDQERKALSGYQKAIQQLDAAVDKLIGMEQITKSTQLKASQTRERTLLTESVATTQTRLNTLLDEREVLSKNVRIAEAEVGPIRYVAEAIYGDSSTEHLDSAVRIMIMLLVFVFDPLALLLIVATNRQKTTIMNSVEANSSWISLDNTKHT